MNKRAGTPEFSSNIREKPPKKPKKNAVAHSHPEVIHRPRLATSIVAEKHALLEKLNFQFAPFDPVFQAFALTKKLKDPTNCPTACVLCHQVMHSNKVYCYKCLQPSVFMRDKLPRVDLGDITLDVIHHHGEKRSKSTALQAQVLAGHNGKVRTIDSEAIPDDYDPRTTMLVFPSDSSVETKNLPGLKNITKIVVIEATWIKAGGVLRKPQLQNLKRIHLKNYQTMFWRYQKFGAQFLATIEAIYYAIRERFEGIHGEPAYHGQFDNLLYLYASQLKRIKQEKDKRICMPRKDEKWYPDTGEQAKRDPTEVRSCDHCGEAKLRNAFHKKRWRRSPGQGRLCLECIQVKGRAGNLKRKVHNN